jgi:hypothetical protein
LSPRIGLTRHAGHVYVTAVFLLLAVTAVQNAIIPILVLAAHAWSRSAAPCECALSRSRHRRGARADQLSGGWRSARRPA